MRIDYSSARIVTTGLLKMKYGNYTLRIQAQDLGTPPNIVYKDLPICVTDYNDNAPRFVSPSHNVTIRVPENATVGSAVITVEATDDDIGQNALVQYRLKQDLIGDFQTFSIDSNSGLITLRQPLNRERQKLYQIRVEAYDQGVPTPLTSELDLTIFVRDVNDYQPQFLIDEFTINFTEHQKAGSERYDLINTVDRDDIDILEKPSLPVCYYIISGNEEGYFHLEPLSHKITTVREVDREERDKHILLVKASEDCINAPRIEGNVHFDSRDDSLLRLVVNILDINDNAPQFVHKVFTGGVTTEADFGSELLQIKAVDKDMGKFYDLKIKAQELSERISKYHHVQLKLCIFLICNFTMASVTVLVKISQIFHRHQRSRQVLHHRCHPRQPQRRHGEHPAASLHLGRRHRQHLPKL